MQVAPGKDNCFFLASVRALRDALNNCQLRGLLQSPSFTCLWTYTIQQCLLEEYSMLSRIQQQVLTWSGVGGPFSSGRCSAGRLQPP